MDDSELQRLTTADEVPWDELRETRNLRQIQAAWRRPDGSWPAAPANPEASARTQTGSSRRALPWIAAAAIIVLVLLGGLWTLLQGPDSDPATNESEASKMAAADRTVDPEAVEGSRDQPEAVPNSERAAEVKFSEGSRATLHANARVAVARDDGAVVNVQQAAGRVRYEVVPGLDREFLVEAGEVQVRVVGTVFTVSLVDDAVDVSVEDGRVEVLSPGRQVLLGVGERISIRRGDPVAAEVETEPEVDRDTGSDGRSRRDPARTLSAEEYMRRADEARGHGDLKAAAAALRQLVQAHPDDKRVPAALFTLGRIEARRGHHAKAARAFESHSRRFPTDPLAEDALFNAGDSWAKAGRPDRAAKAAKRYLSRHPSGLKAKEARALAGEPEQ